MNPNEASIFSGGTVLTRDDVDRMLCQAQEPADTFVVPEGVVRIGKQVFYDRQGIKKIVLPETVTVIEDQAFYYPHHFTDCDLVEVNLPAALTELGEWAFANTKIQRLIIPDGVKKIGQYAFHYCAMLTNISMPAGLKTIERGLFEGCASLREISLPEGLTAIHDGAFEQSGIAQIVLPDSVTEIGSSAFAECKELQRFTVPDGIRTLPYGVFKFCSQLKCVSLPAGLTKIDERAFQGCAELTEIQLPSTLEEIGYATFFGCQKLREVILPDSIRKIDDTAFLNCGQLEIKIASCRENPCVQAFLAAQEQFKNKVILACPTCGQLNKQPLPSWNRGKTLAYCSCVKWGEESPALFSTVTVEVEYPFCCTIGECFAADYGQNGEFIQAMLLEIVSIKSSSAVIRAEVQSIGNRLSYVARLSERELDELDQQGTYHYTAPHGDVLPHWITMPSENMVRLENSYGGDIYYTDYIFTDADGVDHLVEQYYSDFEECWCAYGDEVLGLHKFCPIQWENGLLIHHGEKVVMLCDDNVVDAVIPEGIEAIGWFVFYNKPHLESITIPASVRHAVSAFNDCPSLRKITLIRNPSQDRDLETMLRKIFPAVEIVVKNADWNEMVQAQIKRKKPRTNPGEAYENAETSHRGWRARHIKL